MGYPYSMTPRLSICLLGPLDVRLGVAGGEPVSGLHYNKMRALLAYLAVEVGQPHARSHLCALLWPDSAEQAARQSLSQALTRLRRALSRSDSQSPLLLTTTESIQLNPAAEVEVDVNRLEALIHSCDVHATVHRGWHLCTACAERLRQAVALYRGDFLAEFFLEDSAPFEAWALLVRQRQRQHILSALERLARYAEWRGAHEQAVRYLRRQVELEPWLEANQRSLMRQLALSGQTTAALAHYEHLRRSLAEELQAAPEAETLTLYQQIKEGTLPASTDDQRRTLPAPPTRLIGREAEIEAALALLAQDDVRALTITGAPGIGKTRLALELGHRLRFDFQEGAYWVDLAPIRQAAQVPSAVAQALGIREQAGRTLPATLAAALKHSHLLIVLDNFEHVQDAAVFLAELLTACPALKVIVTSRTLLGIRVERQYTLTPLPLPPENASPAVIAASPAVQLFVKRVQAVRGDFLLTEEQAGAVAALCARLDGLPLAIELIAARAQSHAKQPAALLAELESGLAALGSGWRDLPERQRTLTRALQWSLNLLNAEQQQVFVQLGVFAGGLTAEGLEAVVVARPSETLSVAAVLEALHQASLVQVHQVEGERRFTLLETTRQFALEQLRTQGQMEAARAAHADYYCALAERAQPELTGPDQVAWFRRLERELANLRVALTWSQASTLEINTRLAVALGNFWIGHGHMSEGRRWLKEALQDERGLSVEWQAQAMMVAGRLAWKQGDFREAQLLLTESRDLFRQMGNRAGLALALFNLGVTVERQGDYTTGQTYLEESLQLARRVGETYTAACALGALAEVANWQGDMARDRLYLEEALAAHRARRDPRMTAATLMNLGISNVDTGEFEVGRRHIQASLDVARELDDPQFTADCLLNLGDVLVAQGRPAEARGYLEEAIGIYHATHNAASADAALATLGQALEKLGDFDGAHARQASALRLRAEAGDQYHVALSLTHLARVLWRKKSAERAAQLLGAADAIRDALGVSIRPSMQVEVDQLVAGLQADLGEGAYRQAWEAGRRLSQEEAVAMGTE